MARYVVKLFVLMAVLLASPGALACDLSLLAPAKSALKKPVQVEASLADDTLSVRYSVTAPSLNARKVLGPRQYPYMFDVVELFVTVSETAFPYYEFEVSPYNQTFQVKIVSHVEPFQEGIDLGLVSEAARLPGGWTADLKIPLKALGWDGDPRTIRENLMPFWSALHAAIGVHSCRAPKNRTFISRSFFSHCFSANRRGGKRDEKT